jgi:hypothetical protein
MLDRISSFLMMGNRRSGSVESHADRLNTCIAWFNEWLIHHDRLVLIVHVIELACIESSFYVVVADPTDPFVNIDLACFRLDGR